MTDIVSPFRAATPADAAALAELVQFASEGLALSLWARIAPPGVDPWTIGWERARRETGGVSYRNAILVERDAGIAAGLIGYALADVPEPTPVELPSIAVPLQELQQMAPGTWYVNVLAAYPEHRGKGYGSALLGLAERQARGAGRGGMSLIVTDTNTGARRLYERSGYSEVARRRMVKDGWRHPGESFLLLTKSISP